VTPARWTQTDPSETIRQLVREWVDKNKGGEDMSNERDELARELFIGDNHNQPRESSIQDWRWFEVTGRNQGMVEHYKTMASHIITVGYRRQVDK